MSKVLLLMSCQILGDILILILLIHWVFEADYPHFGAGPILDAGLHDRSRVRKPLFVFDGVHLILTTL